MYAFGAFGPLFGRLGRRRRRQPVVGHGAGSPRTEGANHPPVRPCPTNYLVAYTSPDGSFQVEHLDGVGWCEAPIPPADHACWAQTKGWTNYFDLTERCACGAIRADRYGTHDWLDRNSRSRS